MGDEGWKERNPTMSKLKSFFGYLLAFLGVPIILISVMGMNSLATGFVTITGLTVSPWFTGGEVAQILDHGAYTTEIHHPVFDALIGQRKNGFVQINWSPKGSVPAQIDEVIDYDNNGTPDFRIQWNTESVNAILIPYSSNVLTLQGSYRLAEGYAVRVGLSNLK
jgi:hypothetical protein